MIAQYSAIYPTFFFVSNMLTIKFGISPILAGSLFGLIHLTAAVLLPSIGNLVDSYGGITKCMVLSAIIGIVTNMLWLQLPAEECSANDTCLRLVLIPIILSGLSYAFVAGTAWNGTFYLIERKQIGTASGL